MSQLKIKDGNNNWIDIPASGIGVPSGGTTGQMLKKSSNTDYATEWTTPVMGLVMDTLYTGNTSATTVALSGDVTTYKLIVVSFLHNGGAEDSYINTVIPVGSIVTNGTNYHFVGFASDSSHLEYAKISFPDATSLKFTTGNVNWSAPKLTAVYGVK